MAFLKVCDWNGRVMTVRKRVLTDEIRMVGPQLIMESIGMRRIDRVPESSSPLHGRFDVLGGCGSNE
jgi:hypothetical protein